MDNRLSRLKDLMLRNNLDAALISSVPNITYLTGFSNFSKDEREAFLLIVVQPQGLTHKTPGVTGYILTDGRYSEAVKKQAKGFELIEVSSKLSLEKAIEYLIDKHRIKKLGIEEKNITLHENRILFSHYNNTYYHSEIINSQRKVKEKTEIRLIEKACVLGDRTFNFILKKIKKGVSEKELAFEIEFFIKKQEATISFPPIVAFGKNSSVPHHVPANNQLTNNQIVLLDFGVKLNNYCSDMTRTVIFGKATSQQRKMYETVLEAQSRAINYLKSLIVNHKSINAKDIDRVARSYIKSQGYPTIPHSLGHGIGLEVHESPHLSPLCKDILKENMVFSIEPGIYLPGFGGVRIEDLVVLKKSELKFLTKSPRQLIELA